MPRKQRSFLFVALTLLITLTLGLIGASTLRIRTTAAAPALIALPPGQTIPPVLVATQPETGDAWDGGPVSFTFDRAMDPASADYLDVSPPLAGDVTVDTATITFTPSATPTPGRRYTFTLRSARAADGVELNAPVTLNVIVPTPLTVLGTTPTDGAAEVATNGTIVVMFDRPVVPLTGLDASADLPQPLDFAPRVAGTGEWLTTSVYSFTPEPGLAGATDYTVTIDNLTTFDGVSLTEPYSFSFSTGNPIATEVAPQGELVAPDSNVRIVFSQPMNEDSVQAVFALLRADESAVEGVFSWNVSATELTFTPDAALDFGAQYTISVSAAAQPAGGQGALRAAVEQSFRVVPLPAVDFTTPMDGDAGVPTNENVTIRFTAPLSPTLALANIDVTPIPTDTQVISYYTEYEGAEVQIMWPRAPQTTYTVTVGAATGDNYGNTLGEDYQFSFTTGDLPPAIQTDLTPFTHFTAFTTTVVAAYYRNVEMVDAALYRLPISDLYRLAGPNSWELFESYEVPDQAANRIWQRAYPSQVAPNELGVELIKLQDDAGADLPPGAYLLQIERPPSLPVDPNLSKPLPTRDSYVIIISNYNLVIKQSQIGDSLAWLTDLATGEPVSDAPVAFRYGAEILAQGVTDSDGLVTATVEIPSENTWEPVLAVSGAPGEEIFAVASTEWADGISPWDFNLPSGYGEQTIQSFFYTDRPIYRPGQTVHWKGIIRAITDDGYVLPDPDVTVDITVRNDRGEEILTQQVTPSAHGTVNGFVELADDAPTGFYFMEALINTGASNPVYAGVDFQVAAYRKPEFEISFTPEHEEYIQGEIVRVVMDAAYFSGGPLAGAPVTWRIISQPYSFTWDSAPNGRSYSFAPYDPAVDDYDPYRFTSYGELIMEGAGVTDADGRYVLEVPAELSNGATSQEWLIDMTVQSATDQFVSNQVRVPVHQSAFYVGISPQSYVVSAGERATVDLITLEALGSPKSAAYPGAELDVTVYEFQWNSVYALENGVYIWQTSVERTPVYSATVTTDRAGAASFTFTPEKPGQYQVTAAGTDDAGRMSAGAGFLYAGGDGGEFTPWRRDNNDRIELVADKEQYAPGEVAKILVPSPFAGPVEALVTTERGGVIDAQVITLAGNSATVEIPITEEAIPNIYVSVVLIKGVDATNPFAAMGVGYIELPVDVSARELAIEIEAKTEAEVEAIEVAPGARVTYTIDVRDNSGAAVAGAEMSAVLVDKALLALSANRDNRSLLDIFYARRPLGVRTGALLVINEDRLSQQLAEGPKGGGGGGDGLAALEIREDFQDVAYWNATLLTDADGQASFDVTLPDNLTTWVLIVRAVTDDTLVGDGRHELVAAKPLQIRPATPRFFTAGDRARIGAVVVNTTGEEIEDLSVKIGVSGATTAGETSFTTSLAAGEQARFDLPIQVSGDAAEVTLTFAATGTIPTHSLTDAVGLTLPVNRYSTPETVATAGEVPPEGRTEAILVPPTATDEGELIVGVEPSLAAGMIGGLDYLTHYPYECNEQVVSRFLPNLFTQRALRELELADPELAEQLAFQLGVGVQKLINRQNPDGGWGYWPGEESSPFISAYVLWGLAYAAEMDYTVPQLTLDRAVDFLERHFAAPTEISSGWELNEMTFLHFVLAEMGEGDPGRAGTLYDVRERLGHYGRAYLAMALAEMTPAGETDPRVETLLDDLFGAAQVSATGASWHEEGIDFQTLNTDLRSTAIILEAFTRLDPDQPLLSNVVRWLMSAREADRWSTTQENAWSIIALTDWLSVTGELEADYAWTVTLNDAELGVGQVTPESVATRTELRAAIGELLRDEINTLRFDRSNASGRMYYTTQLRYYLDALAIDARSRGISVERSFATTDGEPISRAAVGDVISVTTTIVAPQDLYHLLVEAPIPAGTEPINSSLATESALSQGPNLQPVAADDMPWRQWVPTAIDMRDDKVALFATYLPAGAYQYTFQVRAGLPGEYRVLPVHAEQMYFPEVWGRSAGAAFTVTE